MAVREIKFKAWHIEARIFLTDDRILNAENVPALPNGNNFSLKQEHVIFLQWSGLQDSDGQDIYEGHVVYLAGYGHYVCEFPFTELYDAYPEGDIGKILGNIHESPELAEVN